MQYTSLDMIIKSVLLKKGYPLHYYVRYMVSGRDIIQTLNYDEGLMPPNTILLSIDANGEAPLPKDYIDVIELGLRAGQYIHPLVQKNSLNRLPNRGALGVVEPYSTSDIQNFGYIPNMFYSTSYYNEYGEALGRLNIGAGIENDVYKIIPERCCIQFAQALAGQTVVLIYLSNGCGCCTTMGIEPYAKDVIEAYMAYDRLRNQRGAGLGEIQFAQQQYNLQRKIYRARKNPLTVDGIRRILQRSYYSAPKV